MKRTVKVILTARQGTDIHTYIHLNARYNTSFLAQCIHKEGKGFKILCPSSKEQRVTRTALDPRVLGFYPDALK